MNNVGLTVGEVISNHAYSLRGIPVRFEGVNYVLMEIRDGMAWLHKSIHNETADMIAEVCMVEIIEGKKYDV